jgi:hypothetical protein
MSGTSQCKAVTICKFGGPPTYSDARPSLCIPAVEFRFSEEANVSELGVRGSAPGLGRRETKTILATNGKILANAREAGERTRAHVRGRKAAA